MKKVLLLSLGLVMGLGAFAQQQVTAVKKALPTPITMTYEKKALGNEVVKGTANFEVRGTQSVVLNEGVDYMDAESMITTYDLQSNGFVANRMYQAKDGSVAVTATWSDDEYDGSFLNRGTGYNFAKAGKMGKWGEQPSARIEANATGTDIRTGWPTIAAYGAEGEILVNHGHKDGLSYYVREKAGQGTWDGPHAIPNPENIDEVVKGQGNTLSWARIVTTGENNDVLHVFAAASGDSSVAQYYLRTEDLENWTIDFSPLQLDDLHIDVYAADDYAASANGDNIAVVYCTGFASHVMVYESNDGGLTWTSRMVWESPIHGLDWETDENSLFEQLYGPTQASVAIGQDGVTHVALGVSLYDHKNLGWSYSLYPGIWTDGVAYWNDTTAWDYTVEGTDTIPVLSPIRSSQDDSLKHALRLWWPHPTVEGSITMDVTNFCAWMPPHETEGYNAFDYAKQYTGVVEQGVAGDYMVLFGLTAYPSIAVDPAGNLAIAYSSPDMNRALYLNNFYMRSIFVNYKPVDSAYWWQMPVIYKNLYADFIHSGDEATFISAVSTPVNENEFWFSCLSDETPGFHTGTYTSQNDITKSIVNVFKFNPTAELTDEGEAIGLNETIDVVYNIFPNPASEFICIGSSMDADATVTFTNIAGQTVKVVNTNLTTGDNTITVNDLTSGVYFCTVTANGYSHTSKVVVK